METIFILGGDGFCGWPSSLHLSNLGYTVVILDNLSRRNIDNELEVNSLTPIAPISKRLSTWHMLTGNNITFINIDVAREYDRLKNLLKEYKPNSIVHFAEQRAAPYSMKNEYTKIYTFNNNISSTTNLLTAITDLQIDTHIVHLGTMGVYGYGTAGLEIPEGYLNVKIPNLEGDLIDKEIIYPPDPGSVYHLTKVLDHYIFQYFASNDKIRVTDLHQGIVWGLETPETKLHEHLINRFDYDGDYGTVLNRFVIQASLGHPLTVHGTGGQTRAFIHISDTVKCIQLAIENPPKKGDKVKVLNQMSESHKVIDLANMIRDKMGAEISFIENPRNESNENELIVSNKNLKDLGFEPILLSDNLVEDIYKIAEKYNDSVDLTKIPCESKWVK